MFERLQTIQYDPLDVVGKNTDLVLQSRLKDYKKGYINTLLYDTRDLIDGWGKQMSVYLTKDLPYMSYLKDIRSDISRNSIQKHLGFDVHDYTSDIINIIQNDGPKFSKDISIGISKKYAWSNPKPSNVTLDYLFHNGTIGIKKRNNTQKQYDLMTNLVSSDLLNNNPFNSKDEFLEYFLLRRIKSMGLIQNRTGEFFLSTELKNKKVRTAYLNKLVKEDKIKEINIDGLDGTYYVVNNYLDYNQNIQNKVSFIAPLDNLIWDRLLVKDLFDFEYTWEVYTPIIKRKYGYYVLPMIYKTEIIGRIEFLLNRNGEPLEIKNIWYEDTFKQTKQFENSLQKALNQFSKYLNIK